MDDRLNKNAEYSRDRGPLSKPPKKRHRKRKETSYETEVIDRAIEQDIADGVKPGPRSAYDPW